MITKYLSVGIVIINTVSPLSERTFRDQMLTCIHHTQPEKEKGPISFSDRYSFVQRKEKRVQKIT